jgi:ribonuclease-3
VAEFSDLEARLGHCFRDPALLRLALTHPSVAHEKSARVEHNQRLEFLGDAVLQLALTELLFVRHPDRNEGPLTKARAQLANTRALAERARQLDLGAHLILSRGEESTGGRERTGSLADAFEAILGAVYLDGGWPAARDMVSRLFAQEIADADASDPEFNPKGELQERLQALGPEPIRYRVEDSQGPDHLREFEVSVHHRGVELGRGRGKSKKAAETQAAQEALRRLTENTAAGSGEAPAPLAPAESPPPESSSAPL